MPSSACWRAELAACALVLAACGNALPARLDRLCESEVLCGYFPDYDTCLRDHPVVTFATPLRATYHRDVSERCFEAVRDWGCYRAGVPFPGDCPGEWDGQVAEGGDCRADEECVAGTRCDVSGCTTSCCTGTCVATATLPPPDALGATCTAGSCVDGAYCQGASPIGVCVPVSPIGGPCASAEDCAPNLQCAGGTCVAYGLDGDPCDLARTCEPNTQHCAPDGHCVHRLAIGDACDDGHPCVLAARCVSGTCVRDGDLGEPCASGCYVSLHCEGGVCVPNHPAATCP